MSSRVHYISAEKKNSLDFCLVAGQRDNSKMRWEGNTEINCCMYLTEEMKVIKWILNCTWYITSYLMLPVRLKSPISNCLISRETTITPAFKLKLAFKQFSAVKEIQNKLGELVILQWGRNELSRKPLD